MSRPLNQQVVVVVGASSGVGRATAQLLGRRGASVVLAARNERALQAAADEVERLGGKAAAVPTDASSWEDVSRLAERAVAEFGRIDAWVNCFAVSTYGTVEQLGADEIKRVIDVTLLGQIYGMKAAAAQMRTQGSGTIVCVASALARRSVPLQAPYCAAKHGVVGFADSLRLELARDAPGVHVTTLLPSSVNTPLFTHARSKMDAKPKPIPPIYEPDVVAGAIVEVAQRPRREVVVGGGGKLLTLGERISPALVDRYLLGPGKAFKKQRAQQQDDATDNLFEPMPGSGSSRGEFGQKSKSVSLYTEHVELHPRRVRAALAALAAAAGLAALAVARRSQ